MRALSSITLIAVSTIFSGLASAAPSYKEVAPIVAQYCASCHNSSDTALGDVALDSEVLLEQSAEKALLAIKSGLMPIGDETFAGSADGKLLIDYLDSLEPSYSEVAAILQSNCISCHGPNKARKGVRFDSESSAKTFAKAGFRELSSGSMPPRNPNFAKSDEGKKLLQWFANQ